MRVQIKHVEKTEGVIRRRTHHGVAVRVGFSNQEMAIIQERGLESDVVMERGYPSDVDPEKFESKGLARKLATAAVSGRGALHFHLTIKKLMDEDVFWFATPIEAKQYEAELKEALKVLKGYIMGNETIEQKSDSFEL